MAGKAAKSGKLRVLLVDDHPVVRQGLRTMLVQAGDIDVAWPRLPTLRLP